MDSVSNFAMMRSSKNDNIIFGTRNVDDSTVQPLYELEIDNQDVSRKIYNTVLDMLLDSHLCTPNSKYLDDSLHIDVTEDVTLDLSSKEFIDENNKKFCTYAFMNIKNGSKSLFGLTINGVSHYYATFKAAIRDMRDQWRSLERSTKPYPYTVYR